MLTIRRRGKNFHIRGTIRVGQETRIVKEHSCGTDRRDDADAYRSKLEEEIRHEILHGGGGRTHTLTIADAGLTYIARPGGVQSYDLWRLDQINRTVGDRPIAQAADAWTEFKRIRCGGLSSATVQRFKATFSAALHYIAAEQGFDAPKLPRGERVSNKRVRYLTDEQADRLVAAYASHVQPIAIMLRWQGVRIGEALRANWLHVNWKADAIFLPESKNGEPRTITMHRKTRAALHRLWVLRGSPTEGPVFLTNRGEPYRDPRGYKVPSGSPIKKAHGSACRRAGIPDFHVHDWRHHWASHCVMAGIDLETIRQEGGWKSLRMVERYATVSAAHRARVMAKLK
jgi:integrase